VGTLLTPVGVYFLLRSLIRDEEDVRRTLRVWAWAAVVVAADMVFEHLIGQNPIHAALGGAHAFLGNVSERNGSLRASGTFDHPILAGAFGGMSVPLFVGLWWSSKKDRAVAAMGLLAFVFGGCAEVCELFDGASSECSSRTNFASNRTSGTSLTTSTLREARRRGTVSCSWTNVSSISLTGF